MKNSPATMPFQELLKALLDESTILNPRYLYRLSDLIPGEIAQLEEAWPRISARRRQALMEDIEELGEDNTLLSYEALSHIALKDELPAVRSSGVRMLWEYESPDLAKAFVKMMETDVDTEVRAAAASALGKYIYLGQIEELPERALKYVEDHLLAAARQGEGLVRRHALEALGFSSHDDVPSLIKQAYASPDKEWKASALFAMGRSSGEQWRPLVLESLPSLLPLVRMEAARAAGELEIKEALPALLELLQDSNDDVRLAAAWSLSQLGGERAREALEALRDLTDDDTEEADFLDAALENLGFTEEISLMPELILPDGDGDETDEDDEAEFLDLYGAEVGDADFVDFNDEWGDAEFDEEDTDVDEEDNAT